MQTKKKRNTHGNRRRLTDKVLFRIPLIAEILQYLNITNDICVSFICVCKHWNSIFKNTDNALWILNKLLKIQWGGNHILWNAVLPKYKKNMSHLFYMLTNQLNSLCNQCEVPCNANVEDTSLFAAMIEKLQFFPGLLKY